MKENYEPMRIDPMPEMKFSAPVVISWTDPKDGKTRRRERRAKERKSKK